MSETNKKEAGVQEETEKDLPETEPVTEPVEESPEATAGTETTEETESAAEDDKESDKETKGKNSFFGKKKKDNKLEQQIEENLFDVAGLRVICAFQEDIYALSDLLVHQDDIQLLRTKDYIKNPKPNGYRSLHQILEIPVFLKEGKTFVKVEVQFRTIAMDFWASVDHKLRYKKNVTNEEEIMEKLRICADSITAIDEEMQKIRNMIEA